MAQDGRAGSVGWFGLAFSCKVRRFVFPFHFPQLDEKDIIQIPFVGERQSEGKWEARNENPPKRL